MGTLIVSESFMVRESLDNLFRSIYHTKNIVTNSINDIDRKKLMDINYIVLDIKESQAKFLDKITKDIENKKLIVLDFAKNETICEKAIKNGVDGYILNIDSKEDFIYKINSIRKGKKFYDSDLLANVLGSNNSDIELLTGREKEVLYAVSKGYSNREIAQELFITEYTVKKHISSILSKMKFRNRKDIILYFKDKEWTC